jgi:hypothetical protein
MSFEELAEEALLPVTGNFDPYSRDETLWHTCPAHEWERIAFDLNRGKGEERIEMVTRCSKCGAPRCMAFHSEPADGMAELSDEQQQFFRCTLERHHSEPHDFLTGVQIEVGG